MLTLIRAGWVEQIDDGAYRLTLRAVGIAGSALQQAGLGSSTASLLTQLSDLVGETASMAVLQDGLPHIIQRAEVGGARPAHVPWGTALTLHYSASGRVLYAYADAAQAAEIRDLGGQVPTEAICRDVIAVGYALSREGQDVQAIAAPIFDHRGVCVSALSLIAPATRFEIDRFKRPLLEVAAQITRLLHGKPPPPPDISDGA